MPDAAVTARQPHPLIHVAKFLLADLVSTLVFVGLYALTENIYLATGLGIAVGLGQIGYAKWRGQPVDAIQWLVLGLIVVLGGATLLTHNAAFIKLKPTLIYVAVGVVMLKPGWMTRYMPPLVVASHGDIPYFFGYLWSAMMLATGLANLALVMFASTATWAWFWAVFPLSSKFTLVAIQYVTTRVIVRRRLRAPLASPSVAH